MIKEYALQPELLSSGPVCRALSEKFGYGIGRVIARYPKGWEKMVKMVYDSLEHCMPAGEKKMIEVALIRLLSALSPRYHEYDKGKAWLDNAIKEHADRPFSAIIAREIPNGSKDVICVDDLYEEEKPCWRTETQRRIERKAKEMAACAGLLLQTAREILFIDPHFNPQVWRGFKRPLEAFLQTAAKRHASMPKPTRIEIHTGHKSNGTQDSFNDKCKEELPPIIPRGMKIRLVRWDQEHLHNRYILTDKSGLSFSTGLDEYNGRHPKYDDVYLLQQKLYEATWREYQHDNPVFPLIEDNLIIEGIA